MPRRSTWDGGQRLPDLLCYSGHGQSFGHVLKVKEFPSKYNGKLPWLGESIRGSLIFSKGTRWCYHTSSLYPLTSRMSLDKSLDSPRYDALSFSMATMCPHLCHYANRFLVGFYASRLVVPQVIVQTATIMTIQKENLIILLPLLTS